MPQPICLGASRRCEHPPRLDHPGLGFSAKILSVPTPTPWGGGAGLKKCPGSEVRFLIISGVEEKKSFLGFIELWKINAITISIHYMCVAILKKKNHHCWRLDHGQKGPRPLPGTLKGRVTWQPLRKAYAPLPNKKQNKNICPFQTNCCNHIIRRRTEMWHHEMQSLPWHHSVKSTPHGYQKGRSLAVITVVPPKGNGWWNNNNNTPTK